MILLDTNVVSEMMRFTPDPRVVAWIDSQDAETCYLSTVSLAELLLGVAVLPEGRRKSELQLALDVKMAALIADRVLPFDAAAAHAYAQIGARGRELGRPIAVLDGQIAAIAATRMLTVASRDVSPFEAAGVAVIDPWTADV